MSESRRRPRRTARERENVDTRPRYAMSRPDAEELLAWLAGDEADDEALVRVDDALACPIATMPRPDELRVLLALTLDEVLLVRRVLADTSSQIDDARLSIITRRLERQIERSRQYEDPRRRRARSAKH